MQNYLLKFYVRFFIAFRNLSQLDSVVCKHETIAEDTPEHMKFSNIYQLLTTVSAEWSGEFTVYILGDF